MSAFSFTHSFFNIDVSTTTKTVQLDTLTGNNVIRVVPASANTDKIYFKISNSESTVLTLPTGEINTPMMTSVVGGCIECFTFPTGYRYIHFISPTSGQKVDITLGGGE